MLVSFRREFARGRLRQGLLIRLLLRDLFLQLVVPLAERRRVLSGFVSAALQLCILLCKARQAAAG